MSKIRLTDYADMLNELYNHHEFRFGCYVGDCECPYTPEEAEDMFRRMQRPDLKAYWLGRMVAAGYWGE